jgi:hypothetical protein
MGIIYFISLADYGMHLAFMVAGTFTYCHRHSIQYQDYVRMQERRNNGAARGDNGLSVERARSVN